MGVFLHHEFFAATLKGERPTTGIKAEDGNCDAKNLTWKIPAQKMMLSDLGVSFAFGLFVGYCF